MSETHSGGCLSGGVPMCRDRALRDVVNCHRGESRTHGHLARYRSPLSDFKLKSSDSLKWYQSSPQARRGFCSICGASLFWVPEGGGHVAIAAGTLDNPTGLRTVAQIIVADVRLLHNRRRSERRPQIRGTPAALLVSTSLSWGFS